MSKLEIIKIKKDNSVRIFFSGKEITAEVVSYKLISENGIPDKINLEMYPDEIILKNVQKN